jgi:hypothetical protein
MGVYGRLLGTLCAALLLVPRPGPAQSTVTQEVPLEAGWNVLSLNVQPSDSSFEAIFGGEQISMAKDEEGKVYAPGEGIEQIAAWGADEGYQVHAESATTLEVTGTRLRPEETPIVLDEGGNLVPYVPGTAQAVAGALVSIEESLVAVEDEDGNQYNSGASSSPLDSLRPGQGYKVYVDRADTLRYPRVTSTLAEARALQGMEVGSYVRIRGYHEPGDGGGGLFQVTDSGAETDGGTVFVFGEDRSSEQVVTPGTTNPNFAHSDLVWGTLSARVGSGQGEVVSDLDLHGHFGTQQDLDWIDYKNGEIPDRPNSHGLFVLRDNMGDGGSFDITYRYKYATSNRRLERLGVTDAVNIAWWGAPKADPNNPQDAVPYIAWAINKAAKIYQDGNYNWAYVDIPGEYYYEHLIRLRNGVKLRGVGPDRSVPFESWTTKGKLTVPPGPDPAGRAVYWLEDGFSADAENDVYAALGGARQQVTNEYLAEKVGIESLEFDGNYPTNNPWEDPNFSFSGDKGSNALQNGSIWSAFGSKDSGAQEWGSGGTLRLNNVYVHNTGSNGIGAAGKQITTGKNVHLRNSVRNHPGYALGGDTIENLTVSGYGWEVYFKFGKKNNDPTTYKNFIFRDYQSNPEGLANANVISGNLTSEVTLDPFTFDYTQRGGGPLIKDRATGGTYKNGTIRTGNSGKTSLVALPGYRAPDVPEITTWENVEAFNEGSGALQVVRKANRQINIVVEGMTVTAASGADATANIAPIGIAQSPKFRDTLAVPPRNVIKGLDYQHDVNKVLKFGGNPSNYTPFPREQFVKDSQIENVGSDLWGDDGRLGLGDLEENLRAQRVYFDNVTFNVPDAVAETPGANFHGIIGGDETTEMLRLRNCQDRDGRVSEKENQTYTSTASEEGQDYVDIPTSLLSYPHGRSATVTNGGSEVSSVSSIGVVDESGNTLEEMQPEDIGISSDLRDPYLRVNLDGTIQANETIEVEYSAYVTPPDDYQTTGLFVSRPVYDKSYTSGNGPFTVDLRGVAVSQESRDKVVYTASSGDPSVVTASVQSDDYTLELTEQGTGIATITVDAEIPGVGTATTTFEVTVE